MKKCKTCKNKFLVTKNRKTFCSHLCQARFVIKKAHKFQKPKPKLGGYLKCTTCNKEFYVPQYRLKKQVTKYCSRKCLAKKHLKQYIEIHGFKKLNKPHHKYKTIKINGKQIRLHRYIMEQHLGRKLEKWEHVHHINDDPNDNRLENLEVLSNSDHQKKELIFRKKLSTSFSAS